MGILTDRVGAGLEGLAGKFKERLRGWLSGVIGFGLEVFADVLAKSAAPKLGPLIKTLESTGKVPPELQSILNEIKTPTGEVAALFGNSASSALIGGAIGKVVDAILLPLAYAVNSVTRNVILNPDQLLALWRRGELPEASLNEYLSWLGFTGEDIEHWKLLGEVLFPSDTASQLWLRNKSKYEQYWQDVKAKGLTTERIEALKELAYRIPGVQDVIRYAVKEAYTPEIYEAFGQAEEFPEEALPDAEKAGIRRDYLLKEWIAHWELPGVTQGYDMLHRGLITLDQLKLLMKARDIMPFWRAKLIGLSYDLPNRIELRMMARYGLVDKPKLVEILLKTGVDPQYVDIIADMNIAMGLRTDLAARYSKGWINKEQVKAELDASKLAPEINDRMYRWLVKNEAGERVAKEKDLTKAEIIKGVKLGVITVEEGAERLVAMGYDEEEAYYMLAINLEVAAGSPHNVGDFKRLTDLHRMAAGLPTDRTKEEIITSEKAVASKYPQKVKLSEEEIKTRVDTARRKRRRGEITRDQEVTELLAIGLDISLATAYAENDDLRLQKGVGE